MNVRLYAYRVLAASMVVVGVSGCSSTDEPPDDSDTGQSDVGVDAQADADVEVDSGADVGQDLGCVDDCVTDNDPPRIRDLRVSVDGSYTYNLELNAGDRTAPLPVPQDAEWTVWATDDTSDAENMSVEVWNTTTDQAVAASDQRFESGLWYLATELVPGNQYVVVVRDELGAELVSEYMLDLPDLEARMVGTWNQRNYDVEGEPAEIYDFEFMDDGTFSGADPDGAFSGTWSVDGSEMTLNYASGVSLSSEFAYNDGTFFCLSPFSLDAPQTSIEGDWSRQWVRAEEGDEIVRDVSLSLDDTYERNQFDDGDPIRSSSGDWSIVPNESYTDNFGDILVRTVNSRDGETLAEPEVLIDLYRQRERYMCLSPLTRIE